MHLLLLYYYYSIDVTVKLNYGLYLWFLIQKIHSLRGKKSHHSQFVGHQSGDCSAKGLLSRGGNGDSSGSTSRCTI